MRTTLAIVFLISLNVYLTVSDDSYISALIDSRKGNTKSEVVHYVTANSSQSETKQSASTPVRREDTNYDTGYYAEPNNFEAFSQNEPSDYHNAYASNAVDSYLPQKPPKKYEPPSTNYGTPVSNYGPPKPMYGPPQQMYGPPKPMYGPPPPVYGPPHEYGPPKPVYGIPYEAPSIFEKLLKKISFKMSLVTLAKILLKLLIFKKIVKFIAIMCLLLFIPKLIHYKKEDKDEEEERQLKTIGEKARTSTLNELATFVFNAIETYSGIQEGCEKIGCKKKSN